MHTDSSFNETWGRFLAVMPSADDLLTPELFTDELMDMLQTPELVSGGSRHRDRSLLARASCLPWLCAQLAALAAFLPVNTAASS